MHKYQFPIETERLYFHQLESKDKKTWQVFFVNNPNLHFVGINNPKSPEEDAEIWVERQIKRYQETGVGVLGAFRKDNNQLIGNAGLIWRENILGENLYEIGYSVIPDEWRKGFASEMAIRFSKYFEEHRLDKKVISIIHIDNIGSQGVALKNGMTRGAQFEFLGSPNYLYYKEY